MHDFNTTLWSANTLKLLTHMITVIAVSVKPLTGASQEVQQAKKILKNKKNHALFSQPQV